MTERSSDNFLFYGFFSASLALAGSGWIWAWFVLRGIQSPLIIHFSDYTGINQIGGMDDIHGIGATAVTVVVLNFILASTLRFRESRWAKLLAAITLFLAVLLFTVLAAIISVNQ